LTELNTIIDLVVFNPLKNDVFTIAFLMLALLLASVWRNFLIVFVHKAREMVLSHDWRSFEAENANYGPRLRLSLVVVSLGSASIFAYQLVRFSTHVEIQYRSL
jgi:cell division protein FtsL